MNCDTESGMLTKQAVGRLLLLGDGEGRIPLPVCTVQVLAILPVLTDKDSYMSDTFLLKISDGEVATYVLLDTRHSDLIHSDALALGKLITVGCFLAARPLPIATDVAVVSDALECIGSPEELSWMVSQLPHILAQVAANAGRRPKNRPAHAVGEDDSIQPATDKSISRAAAGGGGQPPGPRPLEGPVASGALGGVEAERTRGSALAEANGVHGAFDDASARGGGQHWRPHVEAAACSPRSPRSRWAVQDIDSARYALRCSQLATPSVDAETSRGTVEGSEGSGTSSPAPTAASTPTACSLPSDGTRSPSCSASGGTPAAMWPPDEPQSAAAWPSPDTEHAAVAGGARLGVVVSTANIIAGTTRAVEGPQKCPPLATHEAAPPWDTTDGGPASPLPPSPLVPLQPPLSPPAEHDACSALMAAAPLADIPTAAAVGPCGESAAHVDAWQGGGVGSPRGAQQAWSGSPRGRSRAAHDALPPTGGEGDAGMESPPLHDDGQPLSTPYQRPSPLRLARHHLSPADGTHRADVDVGVAADALGPSLPPRHSANTAHARLHRLLQDMEVGRSAQVEEQGPRWHAHDRGDASDQGPSAAAAWEQVLSVSGHRDGHWEDLSGPPEAGASLQRSVSSGHHRRAYGGGDDLAAAVAAGTCAAAAYRNGHQHPPARDDLPDVWQPVGARRSLRRGSNDAAALWGSAAVAAPAWRSSFSSPSSWVTDSSDVPSRVARHEPRVEDDAPGGTWASSACARPKNASQAPTLPSSSSSSSSSSLPACVEPGAPVASVSGGHLLAHKDERLDRLRSRSFCEVRQRALQDPDNRPLWPPPPDSGGNVPGGALASSRQGGSMASTNRGEMLPRGRPQSHKDVAGEAQHYGGEDSGVRLRSHLPRAASSGGGPPRACLLAWERFPTPLLPVAQDVARLRESALRRALFALEEAEAADLCLEMWGEYFALVAAYAGGEGSLLRAVRSFLDWHRRARIAVDMILAIAAACAAPLSPSVRHEQPDVSPTAHDLVHGGCAGVQGDGGPATPHLPLSDAKERCAAIRHRLQERASSSLSHTLSRSNSAPLAAPTGAPGPGLAVAAARAVADVRPGLASGGAASAHNHAATMPAGGGSNHGHHYGQHHHHHSHHVHSHTSSAAALRGAGGAFPSAPPPVGRAAFSSPLHTTPAPLRPSAAASLATPAVAPDDSDGVALVSPPSRLHRSSGGAGEGLRAGGELERGGGLATRGAERAPSPAPLSPPQGGLAHATVGADARWGAARDGGGGARADPRGHAAVARGRDLPLGPWDGEDDSGHGRAGSRVPAPKVEAHAHSATNRGGAAAVLPDATLPEAHKSRVIALTADKVTGRRTSRASQHMRSISLGGGSESCAQLAEWEVEEGQQAFQPPPRVQGACPTCGAAGLNAAATAADEGNAAADSLLLPAGEFMADEAALAAGGRRGPALSPSAPIPSPSACPRPVAPHEHLASSLLPTAEAWFATAMGSALVPGSDFAARIGIEVRAEWRKHGVAKGAQGGGDATGEIFSLLKLLGEWCADCLRQLEHRPWPQAHAVGVGSKNMSSHLVGSSGGMSGGPPFGGTGKDPPGRLGADRGSVLGNTVVDGTHLVEEPSSSVSGLRETLVVFQRQVRDCVLTATGLASWGPL